MLNRFKVPQEFIFGQFGSDDGSRFDILTIKNVVYLICYYKNSKEKQNLGPLRHWDIVNYNTVITEIL